MLHKSNSPIESAVANCSGAMEADTISKNGVSLKIQTSKVIMLFFAVICFSNILLGQATKDIAVLNSSEYDFGEVMIGKEYFTTFRFRNDSKESIVIKNVHIRFSEVYCDYPRTPIASGEIGEIKVSFKPSLNLLRQRTHLINIMLEPIVSFPTLKVYGKVVGPSKYDNYRSLSFEERRAAVVSKDKWGFIDFNGNEVISLKYRQVTDFYYNRAWVNLNNKWGTIDTLGKVIIPYKYDEILKEGVFAFVKLNGKWGCVKWLTMGEEEIILIPCKYDNITICSVIGWVGLKEWETTKNRGNFPYAWVKLNGKWGCVDTRTAKEIFPCKYDKIDVEGNNKTAILFIGEKKEAFNYNTGELDDKETQFNLGLSYYNGEGVTKDSMEAVYWWRKAAEQGFAKAQNNLGFSYMIGLGVEKDPTQAVYWWRKAAEQEHSNALYYLGICYKDGAGVEKDGNTALYWYEKAIENKDGTLSEKNKNTAETRIKELNEQGYSSSRAKP